MDKHSKILEKQTYLVGTFKDIFSASSDRTHIVSGKKVKFKFLTLKKKKTKKKSSHYKPQMNSRAAQNPLLFFGQVGFSSFCFVL